MRALVLVVSAFLSLPAAAQTADQIQAIAPQLVAFAGSDANLQALVNGLSNGQTITLVTQDATGTLQIVTFTPPAALGGGVATALEQARTALIARGVTQPTAQQIAVALMGGSIVSASGVTPVSGVLTGTSTGSGIQVRNDVSSASGSTSIAALGGSTANAQALATGLQNGTPITLSGAGGGQTVTFTAPGGPMSAFEANQALTLAGQLLAQQGIVNPTPTQIQAALLGGTVTGPNGTVLLQGILQNRTVATTGGTTIPSIPGASTAAAPSTPPPNIPGASTGAAGATPTPNTGTQAAPALRR